MSRAYSVAVAAVALNVHIKWLDNVFSHYTILGVDGGKQGRARRVDANAVLQLSIALELNSALGVPLSRGVGLARALLLEGKGRIPLPGGELYFDIEGRRAAVFRSLDTAVEIAPQPVRGRPPGKTKRGA